MPDTISHLSRSALHRCFQRHGISRLPAAANEAVRPRKPFKDDPIGCPHVDFAELQTEEGKPHLSVAVGRTGKVAFADLQARATQATATDFLQRVLAKLPCKVQSVLTDNGMAQLRTKFVCAQWHKNKATFLQNPTHLTLGLYTKNSGLRKTCLPNAILRGRQARNRRSIFGRCGDWPPNRR